MDSNDNNKNNNSNKNSNKNNSNKNYSLRKKVVYELDNFISKGFWAQVALLIGCVVVLSFICACGIMIFAGGEDFGDTLWESLMHIIDQGTITGDDTDNSSYLLIMLIITFIGMAFTSVIIGLTSSAIQIKMDELNKGHSRMVKKDHTVVLGFNDNIYTIRSEIETINCEKGGKHCLVIADSLPKEEMEHNSREFSWRYKDINEDEEEAEKKAKCTSTTFKSGDPASENTFNMCSVDRARQIIVNGDNDFQTIRILLALTAYLKKAGAYIGDEQMPSVVALIRNKENLSAARIAADVNKEEGTEGVNRRNEYKVRVLYFRDIFSKLFAEACMDSSRVKDIRDIIRSGSSLSRLADREEAESARSAESAGSAELARSAEAAQSVQKKANGRRCMLILGGSATIPIILKSVNNICGDGSDINIITPHKIDYDGENLDAFDSQYLIEDDPYNWGQVKKHLDEHPYWFDKNDDRHLTNMIILSEDGEDKIEADEKVMVLLLNIREYVKDNCDYSIGITSEVKLPQNQMLVQTTEGNDLIIGYQYATKTMVHIAEDLTMRGACEAPLA